MKQNWKRLTGALLALVLCLGILPMESRAEAGDWAGVTHMNIFGAGTDLRGRNYPFARYDNLIEDLLDGEGRPVISTQADDIRYRKAGVMFQAAPIDSDGTREYYFREAGFYDIAFYSRNRLDAAKIKLLGAAEQVLDFTEQVYGSGDNAIYAYSTRASVSGSGSAVVRYDDTDVLTIVLTQVEETGPWPTTMLVTGYRERSSGVLSEVTLELTGFNLPDDPAAYALWDSENETRIAAASSVSGDDKGLYVTFAFDGGIPAGELMGWPNLFINGSLSYYYLPAEKREEDQGKMIDRYKQYGFVQIPSVYSGTCETGLDAINVTNAGATYIDGAPAFSGEYVDYPPDPHLGTYMGLGMPLFPGMSHEVGPIMGGFAPAYFFSAETGETKHEIYLYGTEELDPAQLAICGANLVEPFTRNTFGDGEGTLYFYRGVITKPAADGYIGIVYRDAPLYTLPTYQVADYSKARLPLNWVDEFEPPKAWYEAPAPLVCTCWVDDYQTDEAGVMTSFDVAFSGFNLPTDYSAYSLYCFEAADADQVFARAAALRVDDYGKTIVTFTVKNPQYASCTTYPRIFDCPVSYLAYSSSHSEAGKPLMSYTVYPVGGVWRITNALKTYGMWWGATTRVFSPYQVLGKTYEEEPVAFTWAGTDTVTAEAVITGRDLMWNQFMENEEDWVTYTVLLAVYDKNGRMIDTVSKQITSPQRVSLTADATDGASASLFCLGSEMEPVKAKLSSEP